MKLLQTGDLHLDCNATKLDKLIYQDGFNVVYQNRLKILKHIINVGIENNVDFYCIPGDIFNRNRPYPQEYIDLDNLLKPVKDKVFLSYGNHDDFTNRGCGLQPLAAMGYKVALTLDTWDKFLYFAPWGTPLEAIDDRMKGEGVLLLHGGVKSDNAHWVQVEGEEGNYHLRDLQALGIRAILLQHHHNQTELASNIWYAGSPEVFTFGEEFDCKGFLIWDINVDGIKVTRYSTKGLYPEFKTFTPEEFLNYPDKGINAYVRVKGEVTEQERLDITNKMANFECLDNIYDLTIKTKQARLTLLEGKTDEEKLTNYLKGKGHKNIDQLLKLHKEI